MHDFIVHNDMCAMLFFAAVFFVIARLAENGFPDLIRKMRLAAGVGFLSVVGFAFVGDPPRGEDFFGLAVVALAGSQAAALVACALGVTSAKLAEWDQAREAAAQRRAEAKLKREKERYAAREAHE